MFVSRNRVNINILFVFLSFVFLMFTEEVCSEEHKFISSSIRSEEMAVVKQEYSDSKPYLSRKGRVSVPVHFLGNSHSVQPDDVLVVDFFENSSYRIVVQDVKRLSKNVVTINGRLEDEDMTTFTFTCGKDSYLVTFQNLKENKTYRISGKIKDGIGEVSEIDHKKMPPVIHLPPIIPGK